MPAKKKTLDLHVRADEKLVKALKKAAETEDRTVTLLLNKIVREYLEQHHDYKP